MLHIKLNHPRRIFRVERVDGPAKNGDMNETQSKHETIRRTR